MDLLIAPAISSRFDPAFFARPGPYEHAHIRSSGNLPLGNVSLPDLAVYLKFYTRAIVAAGQLSATVPYRFSLATPSSKALSGTSGLKSTMRMKLMSRWKFDVGWGTLWGAQTA